MDIRDCIKEWLLCFYCPSLSPSLLIGPWDVEYVSVVLFCYILDVMLCYVWKLKIKNCQFWFFFSELCDINSVASYKVIILRYKLAILTLLTRNTNSQLREKKSRRISRNSDFISCNCEFISHNSDFISRNSDFITRNYEFISHNSEKKVRIASLYDAILRCKLAIVRKKVRIVRQKVAITFLIFYGGNGLLYNDLLCIKRSREFWFLSSWPL